MSDSDSDEDALVDDVYAYLVQNSCPKGCSAWHENTTDPKKGRKVFSDGRQPILPL